MISFLLILTCFMSQGGFWDGKVTSVWSWFGRQELTVAGFLCSHPGLLSPRRACCRTGTCCAASVWHDTQIHLCFLLTNLLYSTLIFACTSPDLVVRVAMSYFKSLHLIACVWCYTYSARPCFVRSFWIHFRSFLLVSSPSSLVVLYESVLWVVCG